MAAKKRFFRLDKPFPLPIVAPKMPTPDYPAAVRHVREDVLATDMQGLGLIAGVTGSTVSRWESGLRAPTILAVMRIEEFCKNNNTRLPLRSDWLKNPPRRRKVPQSRRDNGRTR